MIKFLKELFKRECKHRDEYGETYHKYASHRYKQCFLCGERLPLENDVENERRK